MNDYDLEDVYDAEIAPLMTEIIAICQRHGMPLLASFAYARSDDAASFCTTSIPFDGRTPDQFGEALAVIRRERPMALALRIKRSDDAND
jgi:tRNA(His) 5'-end guanylyltransferase